jgi:NADH-quinone oxidoreductase subunit K
MSAIPLWWYLVVAAALFSIGLYGTLTRENAVSVLMGVELMLNAVNLNAVALWRFITPAVPGASAGPAGEAAAVYLANVDGQIFAVFVIALAAAEAAVGLALIIAMYRSRQSVNLDDFTLLKG